ncbi:MAG: hypothetical protein HN353_12205 [Bdellovibrionales bacterium]|jgi:hypothetical protein|nr:hypothetical protein [Bdellovibrionales bacterium]MBT3526141.1 hypothetical protein [Bdellovibrionales bacterium]MBT7768206.1 hypothetical protein [Bdellovibrionales bacterium]
MNSKARKNPLYVVTNNGKDVERVRSLWDALVKKFGIGPLVEFINIMLQQLFALVTSYPMLVAVNRYLNQLFEQLQGLFALMPTRSS